MIHIITGESPATIGGVGAYTAQLAGALIEQGQGVHIWTARRFHPSDLARLGRELDAMSAPRRILVQWTPHSFGLRSLNLAFPLWLWKRSATTTDQIEVIVHEAFLAFGEGNWRQNAAAAVQRVMAIVLLRAARKVWVTIPKWEEKLRPWALGKNLPFEWLPVPSNIPAVAHVSAIVELRRNFTHFRHPLIGHFGTYRQDIETLLFPALLELETTNAVFLLVGRGSEEARWRFVTTHPEFSRRVFATGELDPHQIAAHLSACDVLLQPFPDGISTRRGSAMAALSLGVPVVTNPGALSEPFWDNTEAVAMARSSSPAHLAAATRELIADHARRGQMSAQARDLYQDRFHIRHTVAALLRAEIASAPPVTARAKATA